MDPSSANEVYSSDVLESVNVGYTFGSSTETNVPVSHESFDEKGSPNHGKQLDEKNDRNGFSDSNDTRSNDKGEMKSGLKYWIPNVDMKYKPKMGDFFESVELAEKMYRKYAEEVGFDVRLSNKKINKLGHITSRYYVCSKEGIPSSKDFSNPKMRNSNIKRTGCGACFKIHFVKERSGYEVYKFVEQHNHMLFNKEEMRFLQSRKQLKNADHRNVSNGSSSKVALTGGVDFSGDTVRDQQNFERDMVSSVGNKDVQMLLNVMANRRKVCPEFFFEYKCDDKELLAIFWADETARLNYREFGDVISFDATIKTDKHAMVFVPFIAIDNHKKSVVVGAALMHNDSADDFTWVLNAFVKGHGRQPHFVITVQRAAMKQAISIAFPESKHRLCMWHIIEKVKSKISNDLKHRTSFINEFNKLVRNVHLDPEVFERQWNKMVDLYGLRGDSWFDELYEIRESWIPAYYKDSYMSCLMKTTSRSESINAFFNVYANFGHDLVVFLHSFDNAIDTQRAKHGSLELTTKSTVPRLVSPRKLEAHAADVYTRTIFFEFQKEIKEAAWFCRLNDITNVGETRVYTITHKNKEYMVVYNKTENTYDCSCNLFIRHGILCRHALYVMLNNDGVNRIPEKYILGRWRRDLVPIEWLPARLRYGEVDLHTQENTASIQEFLEVSQPETVVVVPRTEIPNKGCGTGKRLTDDVEKEISKGKKLKRMCRLCRQLSTHDSRNCPNRGSGN